MYDATGVINIIQYASSLINLIHLTVTVVRFDISPIRIRANIFPQVEIKNETLITKVETTIEVTCRDVCHDHHIRWSFVMTC